MGVFDPKNEKSRKSKMKKDAIEELSSNVNNTPDGAVGGATIVGTNSAFTFDSMVLVHLLLPLTLVTLIWGRKWIFTRVFLQLDRSCISLLCPSISKRERLMRWTSEQLPISGGIQDSQLRNLWLDGSHLCSLINSVVPGACANPHRHWKRAPTHAQALAYKYFGIVPVFTEADFRTETMTQNLEDIFQIYLSQLQTAISKISQEQAQLKRSHSNNYIARGMGLTTGEQFRKNYFYIYPTELNHQYEDVIIAMKGPYNTYGSVVLSSLNLLNGKSSSAPFKSSIAKEIYQQCEKLQINDRSILRNLSINLTNITSTGIVRNEHDKFDFEIKFEKGRAKVGFISKNNGIHELCITTHGEHISMSPFNINIEKNTSGVLDTFTAVTNKHVYKRVNRKIIKNEIDFVTEKLVFSNNSILYDSPIIEESNIASMEMLSTESMKILTRQANLDLHKEVEYNTENDMLRDQENKSINSEVDDNQKQVVYESIDNISNIAAELELLVEEETLTENNNANDFNNSDSINCHNQPQDLNIPIKKHLLSEGKGLFNVSSDLSNIELEELEDAEDISETASVESTNKTALTLSSNKKVQSTIRKQSSKINSNHSIYCSSEFSTNSIELEELEDNDLSSDEFLYFGQNIYPQDESLIETSSPKSSISVKERIAYYNKSPREFEEVTEKVYAVDIPQPSECTIYEPDILICHTVKYSEIATYTSPIWKHIVQEENPIQNITLLNTSSEIGQETNVLNSSTISSYSTNNKDSCSSDGSYLEENNNSILNIRGFPKNDLEDYPQSYYNKSSEEFSEMFKKRKQFWDRQSVEHSSGCSSDSSLSNPIVSSYSFYNNRRLSTEKNFVDKPSHFHRSLDCFQSQQYNKESRISDDDLCKSTDDLAFPSVKERKLLFIKEMNNHWSKSQTQSPLKTKYLNNQILKIPEKVVEHEEKKIEEQPIIPSVQDKIKLFDRGSHTSAKLKLQIRNKENLSKSINVIPSQSKNRRKSETILSHKENFQRAQSYFKTLETGKQTVPKTEFNINQIERRHSIDCEKNAKKLQTDLTGGSLRLPRVSERFPLDNIYKDVLGDRKSASHFKGSANKEGMIVTLHSMPDKARELDVETEFKEELFFGQKKFKDRPKLNSVFPIHY